MTTRSEPALRSVPPVTLWLIAAVFAAGIGMSLFLVIPHDHATPTPGTGAGLRASIPVTDITAAEQVAEAIAEHSAYFPLILAPSLTPARDGLDAVTAAIAEHNALMEPFLP